jgi:hypothetical protein
MLDTINKAQKADESTEQIPTASTSWDKYLKVRNFKKTQKKVKIFDAPTV